MAKTNASLRLSEEEFLCHACGPDPLCNQDFSQYIDDIDSMPDLDTLVNLDAYRFCDYEYAIAHSSDSVLLLSRVKSQSQWVTVGYYNTPSAVCIMSEHQGRGLGAELILHTAIHWSGGPPTACLDEQMFSVAGWYAHKAAYRLGVRRGLIVPKIGG